MEEGIINYCALLVILCHVDQEDHGDVLDSVESLAAQWRILSTMLRLKEPSLAAIKGEHRDVRTCLSKALIEWLKRNYNHKEHGRPSWRRLAQAVKDLDNALFEKIAIEYPAPA